LYDASLKRAQGEFKALMMRMPCQKIDTSH
jgi:hypothetical protein